MAANLNAGYLRHVLFIASPVFGPEPVASESTPVTARTLRVQRAQRLYSGGFRRFSGLSSEDQQAGQDANVFIRTLRGRLKPRDIKMWSDSSQLLNLMHTYAVCAPAAAQDQLLAILRFTSRPQAFVFGAAEEK